MLTRRTFSSLTAALVLSGSSIFAKSVRQEVPPYPGAADLKSGDLLWPKKPGAYVPYDAAPDRSREADRQQWEKEKEEFLANAGTKAPYMNAKDLDVLRNMTFGEFYRRYATPEKPPSKPTPYSAEGPFYVGHTAIVLRDGAADPWIIEAIWGKGVVRSHYSDWIAGRPGERVWHGRIREVSEERRTSMAKEASKYLGQPYDFWNFDLNSDIGFYCSKLVWLATYRSLNFAIDGNANPRRVFWFSPKQLLYTRRILILLDQGSYTDA